MTSNVCHSGAARHAAPSHDLLRHFKWGLAFYTLLLQDTKPWPSTSSAVMLLTRLSGLSFR